MLAHNAAVGRVPFDFGSLLDAPQGSVYLEALQTVTDLVSETRRRADEEAKVPS